MHLTRRTFLSLGAGSALSLVLPPAIGADRKPRQVRLRDGRQVPALGMGSWHLGQGEHPAPQEITALRTGMAHGVRLIDTAEMYSGGNAERLIGRAVRGRRNNVYLVSKILPSDATRTGIPKACEGSLKRLGTDHLDLYLLHWRGGANLAVVVDGFERLRKAGKIGAWGVSNFGVKDMQDLWRIADGNRCAVNQVRYNVADRSIESDLLPWCRKNRVAIMAYSPLGSGSSDLIDNDTLARIGKEHGVTGPAVALAWAIRSGHVIAIPESGSPKHIREDAKALTLNLSDQDLALINQRFPA